MFGRIEPIVAAGEHGDRPGRQTCSMRRRIDTAGQTGNNGETGFTEFMRNPLGEFQSRARSIARADNRHHRHRQRPKLAADCE